MVPGILFIALSAILFVFAYLLYFKEAYWLISGVNMKPRQTVRERYDLPGLTRHLGKMCALIGLILLISGAGAWAGYETVFLVPVFLIFVIVPFFLFGSERYILEGRKTQRIINVAITALMGLYQQGRGEDALRIRAEGKTVLINLGSREKNNRLEEEILNAIRR